MRSKPLPPLLVAVLLLGCSLPAVPAAARVCDDLAPHLAAGARALATPPPDGPAAFAAYHAAVAGAARAGGAAETVAALDALAPGRAVGAADEPLAGCLLRGYLVARYGERLVPDLQAIVGFRTFAEEGRPNWDAPEFVRQREWLAARAVELGFGFRSFDGRMEEFTLPASPPATAGEAAGAGAPPILAVLTHGDVQGVEGQAWSSPPWEGRLVGDRIIGRGTEDDKGPIVAALYALAALSDTGWPRAATVKLLVANAEESSWEEIPYYLERAPAPAMTLGVDAAYPVTHAQKGFAALTVRAGGAAAGATGSGAGGVAGASEAEAGDAAGAHAGHDHDHGAAAGTSRATPAAPGNEGAGAARRSTSGRVRVLRMSGGSDLAIIPEHGEALLEVAGRSAEEALAELQPLAAAWPPPIRRRGSRSRARARP